MLGSSPPPAASVSAAEDQLLKKDSGEKNDVEEGKVDHLLGIAVISNWETPQQTVSVSAASVLPQPPQETHSVVESEAKEQPSVLVATVVDPVTDVNPPLVQEKATLSAAGDEAKGNATMEEQPPVEPEKEKPASAATVGAIDEMDVVDPTDPPVFDPSIMEVADDVDWDEHTEVRAAKALPSDLSQRGDYEAIIPRALFFSGERRCWVGQWFKDE